MLVTYSLNRLKNLSQYNVWHLLKLNAVLFVHNKLITIQTFIKRTTSNVLTEYKVLHLSKRISRNQSVSEQRAVSQHLWRIKMQKPCSLLWSMWQWRHQEQIYKLPHCLLSNSQEPVHMVNDWVISIENKLLYNISDKNTPNNKSAW